MIPIGEGFSTGIAVGAAIALASWIVLPLLGALLLGLAAFRRRRGRPWRGVLTLGVLLFVPLLLSILALLGMDFPFV